MSTASHAVPPFASDPGAPMPEPPAGFEACRVGYSPQVTHLVELDEAGSNGGRPTVCALTRFDTWDAQTRQILRKADLPGWGMGGGVSGGSIVQVRCPGCWPKDAS